MLLILIVLKTLLANGVATFFIEGKLAFRNSPINLPWNPIICSILDSWVFECFISTDELLAKALRRFQTYLSVSNDLCGKLVTNHIQW